MSVVVGYIPTAEGRTALDRAVAEAKSLDTMLIVVNSTPGNALVDSRFVPEEDVQALSDRLEATEVRFLIVRPTRGRDAAEEVLQAVEDHGAELVVIGLRKRSPVGKLLLGSTAQRILLQAPCAVLTVKTE